MKGFNLSWTILAIFGNLACGQRMDIPPELLAALNNATTFDELKQRVTILPSTRSAGQTLPSTSMRSRGGGIGGVSPSLSRSKGTGNVNLGGNMPVIEDPKQSRDSCKLLNVCVSLPVVEYTGVVLFPNCIELPQCMGGCCESGNTCHADKEEPVKVKYRELRFVGTGDGGRPTMESQEYYVEMVRHVTCGCNRCTDKPACNDRQEVVNCKCQCRNENEKSRCDDKGGGFRWSEDKCQCKCNPSQCQSNMYFDRSTCRCQRGQRFDDEVYDDVEDVDRENVDVARWNEQSDESHGTRRQNVRRPSP